MILVLSGIRKVDAAIIQFIFVIVYTCDKASARSTRESSSSKVWSVIRKREDCKTIIRENTTTRRAILGGSGALVMAQQL